MACYQSFVAMGTAPDGATIRLGIDTLIANILVIIITVARDRDSDSERLLYFGRVSFLQSPAIAIAIARDCYILVVFLFLFFFRPPNFRRPWADFRETLPHDAVCAEIIYVL